MGSTSKHGLRYPESTVLANTLHTRIKELADDVDQQLDYTSLSGGFQDVRNLSQFQDATADLAGYMVFQTNLAFTNVMTRLHIQGYTYDPTNNIIDLIITFYPFTGGSIVSAEVVNQGSFNFKSIGIYKRNSDNKIAIVLESWSSSGAGNRWQYPKLTWDGMFGQTAVDPTIFTPALWPISRVTSLTAYTLQTAFTKQLFGAGDDTGWVALPTQNNWSAYSTSFPARYKREGGWVTVEGLITKSVAATDSDDCATLPARFRPLTNLIFNATTPASPFSTYIYMTPSGVLSFGALPNATWTSLAGIQFKAEQ